MAQTVNAWKSLDGVVPSQTGRFLLCCCWNIVGIDLCCTAKWFRLYMHGMHSSSCSFSWRFIPGNWHTRLCCAAGPRVSIRYITVCICSPKLLVPPSPTRLSCWPPQIRALCLRRLPFHRWVLSYYILDSTCKWYHINQWDLSKLRSFLHSKGSYKEQIFIKKDTSLMCNINTKKYASYQKCIPDTFPQPEHTWVQDHIMTHQHPLHRSPACAPF